MNNLSWFIYLTQVVDEARSTFGGVNAFIVIAGSITFFVCLMARFIEDETYPLKIWLRIARWSAPVLVLSIIAYTVIPSRQTMLLIAGSEMGERIVKSDAVKDIVNPGADLLKAWIKDETDKITNKKK